MTTLDNSFEADLREAVLDEAETQLVGQQANLVFEFVELVHANLRAYADRHGYDVESTIDSLGTPQVDRRRDRISIVVGWESEQMARWEFGTSAHTISGDPVLSFVWKDNDKRGADPPQWVREEFEQEGEGWRVFLPEVTVRGLPESRAIRDSLNGFRRVLQA